ncbi:MAG: heme NO-binding domain-containing protein, partial [Myxococcota bacterium]
PSFHFERTGPSAATLTYESERALPDLAEGLLIGCFSHYASRATIRREDLSNGAGTKVNFYIEEQLSDERE